MNLRPFILFFVLALVPTLSHAFSCVSPEPLYLVGEEPTPEQRAEDRAKILGEFFAERASDQFVVVGSFRRETDKELQHHRIFESYKIAIADEQQELLLPSSIQFTYVNEFSFRGSRIVGGALESFETDKIELRVSVWQEYEGLSDQIPPLEKRVVGLMTESSGQWSIVETNPCGTFFEISDYELQILLQLMRSE